MGKVTHGHFGAERRIDPPPSLSNPKASMFGAHGRASFFRGEGSFGSVYRCTVEGQPTAVKILSTAAQSE